MPHAFPVRQASALPAASFGFRLATDTLAVRLTVPPVGPVEDFHLPVGAPCWAHQRKGHQSGAPEKERPTPAAFGAIRTINSKYAQMLPGMYFQRVGARFATSRHDKWSNRGCEPSGGRSGGRGRSTRPSSTRRRGPLRAPTTLSLLLCARGCTGGPQAPRQTGRLDPHGGEASPPNTRPSVPLPNRATSPSFARGALC